MLIYSTLVLALQHIVYLKSAKHKICYFEEFFLKELEKVFVNPIIDRINLIKLGYEEA